MARNNIHVSKKQHIRNLDVRSRLNVTTTALDEIRKSRLRMFTRIVRDTTAPPYLVAAFNAARSPIISRRGRPPKSWLNCISEDLATHNLGIDSATRLIKKNFAKFTALLL